MAFGSSWGLEVTMALGSKNLSSKKVSHIILLLTTFTYVLFFSTAHGPFHFSFSPIYFTTSLLIVVGSMAGLWMSSHQPRS